jgi:CDP-glycerol glycerophosphotransferase (TagB/SpsB family)
MRKVPSLILDRLSYLVPRHKNIWIFGSANGLRYHDNSRHLFEYVCENLPAIRAVWLTRTPQIMEDLRRKGYESYLVNSWQGYWLSCRAGLVIACFHRRDVCLHGISSAIKINLWHGVPLKKLGLDSPNKTTEKWDRLISTSPLISKRMASAYGVDLDWVKITGYPRNDILFPPNIKPLPIIESLKEKLKPNKIVLYAPTWRQDPQDQINLFENFHYRRFSDFLRECNALLLIKMHHWHGKIGQEKVFNKNDDRIYWLKEEDCKDFNYLLPDTDVLLTDYSGAYFDYLLLNRPMIFTPFDLDKYLKQWGLYEDYNEATPGPKCSTWDDVMEQLQEILSGQDKYKESRKLALKKYHTFVDANSCQRVANYLLELSNKRFSRIDNREVVRD